LKVTLIARTGFIEIPESVEGTPFGEFFYSDRNALMSDSDTLSHFAGRSCYQAWKMEHEKTANNMGYLENILSQGHESVLEHGSATFYIEGVSRNLTHELIRHRHLSYSELSQRFVNMENANYVVPPAVRPHLDFDTATGIIPLDEADPETLAEYQVVVEQLMEVGKSRKQAREAARYYLRSGMETRIVLSGNHRAFRDMLKKRYSTHADAEICELAGILLEKLRELAPGIYQDFPNEPFE
jgi:thymidylate synthase (FAD)